MQAEKAEFRRDRETGNALNSKINRNQTRVCRVCIICVTAQIRSRKTRRISYAPVSLINFLKSLRNKCIPKHISGSRVSELIDTEKKELPCRRAAEVV